MTDARRRRTTRKWPARNSAPVAMCGTSTVSRVARIPMSCTRGTQRRKHRKSDATKREAGAGVTVHRRGATKAGTFTNAVSVALTDEEMSEVEIGLSGFESKYMVYFSTREVAIKDLRDAADWLEGEIKVTE
jgi:hypothetical protein